MNEFNATNNSFIPEEVDLTVDRNSFKQRFIRFISPFKNMNKKQWAGIISILLLIIGISIGLSMSGQVQKYFTRAFAGPDSYGYGVYNTGSYLGASTTASPEPSPSSTASVTPSSSPTASPSASPLSSLSPSPSSALEVGDLDNDTDVDIFDFALFVADFRDQNLRSDFNHNQE